MKVRYPAPPAPARSVAAHSFIAAALAPSAPVYWRLAIWNPTSLTSSRRASGLR